jgi:DNA excision repair protein ERCC-4
MVYDNSIEERKYLSTIRREREAFEKLIREKSNMAIPIDQDGRTQLDPADSFWQDFDSRLGRSSDGVSAPQVIISIDLIHNTVSN